MNKHIKMAEDVLRDLRIVIASANEKLLDSISAIKKLQPLISDMTNKEVVLTSIVNDMRTLSTTAMDEPQPVEPVQASQENTKLTELMDRASYKKLLKVMFRLSWSVPFMTSNKVKKVPGHVLEFPTTYMIKTRNVFKIRSMSYLEEYFNELIVNGLHWASYLTYDYVEYVVFNRDMIAKELERIS